MDNLGMWVVILILAYAVYRLWDSSERESERHHDRIEELEWKVRYLEEEVFAKDLPSLVLTKRSKKRFKNAPTRRGVYYAVRHDKRFLTRQDEQRNVIVRAKRRDDDGV